MARKKNYRKGNNSGGKDYRDERSFDKNEQRERDSERYSKKEGAEVLSKMGSKNDFAWYNRNPQLIKDATHFSFYNQLGRPTQGTNINEEGYRVPGICVLDTLSTPGYSNSVSDPASVAAVGMYEYIRKQLNKPNPDYEPADLLMMCFAIEDLNAQYANIMRAFGLIGLWNMDNLYYPRAILHAIYGMSNAEYENCINNLANLRARFNQLIYRASFLFMPADFSLTQRHAWMYSNVFRDHKTRKGQLYAYSKAYNWKFDETTYDTGSACTPRQASIINTYDPENGILIDLLDQFEECIEVLRNSSSVRIMQADMRQAFADRQAWKLAWCDEGFQLSITDSDEVLSQIENTEYLDIMGLYGFTDFATPVAGSTDVTQNVDSSAVVFAPTLDIAEEWKTLFFDPYVNGEHLINMHWDDPQESDIAVATRNKFAAHYNSDGNLVVEPCSDIVLGFRVVINPDDYEEVWYYTMTLVADVDHSSTIRPLLGKVSFWSAFDWAPAIRLQYIEGETDQSYFPFYEWDNYTFIDGDSIRRLNNACLNSMWSIPQYGAYEG